MQGYFFEPLRRHFRKKYGRANGTGGYHFLYYDLKQKRVKNQITQKEYDSCLSRQRWSLYRQYYNEGKRKIKIEETLGCDSLQAELRKQDRLPRTEDEIIERASRQNSDSDRLIQAGMTVLAFKISCARGITPADSTAISQRLFNYFKSRPYNLLYVIDEKDYAIDPVTQKCKNSHLEAVRALLDGNYHCQLSNFVTKNPTECLKDTTLYYTSDPEPVVRRPRYMSISLVQEERADMESAMEETESGVRGAGIRQPETETGQPGAGIRQSGAESEEEENTGVGNTFLQARTGDAQQLTPAAEVNALIALYNATRGRQWENTINLWWYPTETTGLMPSVTADTDISNWYGVRLDAGGHVEELDLFYNNLTGTLPVGFSACTKLKYLNLGYNTGLTGSLETFRNMRSLEELNLSHDQFSGSLRSLTRCVKLRNLNLSDNRLTGHIDSLARMPELTHLDLSEMQLPGNLSGLSSCTKLEQIRLSGNRFSGSLSVLLACRRLRTLNLFGNSLTGSLAELGSKPDLEVLDLYSNKLTGTLSGLSGYTNLKELFLSYNQFAGSIDALQELTDLERVWLSGNQLSGSLPDSLNCKKMKELFLSYNRFTGSTNALGQLPLLETVRLHDNQFSGSLSGLLSCHRLRYLEVRNNKFTFTDLQGLTRPAFRGQLHYFPQASVDTDQRIECRLGEPFTLTTDIDRSTTTPCTYQWFKKIGSGEPIPLNTESAAGHTCLFTPEIADKEAELYYIIKNENFRDLTLTSQKRKLRIAYTYCLKWSLHPEAPAAKLWDFDVKEQKRKCRAVQEAMAAGYVERMVDTYIDEKTSRLILKRDSSCLKNIVETLGITYTNKEHHYTLYYYDQAGNLVQTVPPQGVQTAATGNPAHTLKTTYRYNAQNQVVQQTTPDAGTSHFYYNKKGQLRFSQNAQQALESRYAYTKYDAQGRITETGEATPIDLEQIEESHYPEANRTDVTHTHYDAPAHRSPLNQKYLRTRVSYTETIEKNTTDTTRTYYSYDPHGSVNILLQKLPGLPPKTTHYRYDLVSGKVNYVFYQYKKPDQFVHRYTYDSDNRIREVFTSADRYVWHKDAAYQYYLHGPLATTELGHWRNQAMNYTYTLQGWIKGVNTIAPTDNMVGQSVMSYQLGYYKNDYKPIGAAQNNVTLWTRAQENIAHQGMYNGNISWMETDLKLFKKPQAMLYKYDQLNRITKSRSLEFSNGNYAVRTGDKKYDENYSYDANGNILTLQRRDNAATLADDFNYSYYANTNRLLRHKTTGGTYVYDAIGNLITDNNENLQIAWTPSGKVRSVTKPDTTIYFRYDATGNRIAKIVSTAAKNDTTIYVRDASGNVMSIYRNNHERGFHPIG